RPPNPFILYRKDKWHIIKNDPRHADLRQADLSKFLGDAWRAESEDVKLEYQRRAAECKAEHTRLYPDYKYAPQ
ncbi:high mobility group box domain-containing protein, partial [Trametes meyenii]